MDQWQAFKRIAVGAAVAFLAPSAFGLDIQTFEAGFPAGWTSTGSAWTVGGSTGTNPNLAPAQGLQFARSGAPNGAGLLGESLTGNLTSPAITVTQDTVQWLSVGWSGQAGNGLSRYEILNSSFAVVATVAAPLSDSWSQRSVNLLSSGFVAGDLFYFRAVDGNNGSGYAWLGLDDLKLVGSPLSVPEPATWLLFLVGVGLFGHYKLRSVRRV